MNHLDTPSSLGAQLRALAPPMSPPADVMAALRPRIRRRRLRRTTAMLSIAAISAGTCVTGISYVRNHAPLPRATVHQYLAAGDPSPAAYTGPGIPSDLTHIPLWLVAQRPYGAGQQVIVSYVKDDHPCLGIFRERPLRDAPDVRSSGFEGSCSHGDRLDLRWAYGAPHGPQEALGPDALLYGTVPREVRIVRAVVKGGQLSQRYVTTIPLPGHPHERLFVFDSPGGAGDDLVATLTFYDADGQRVGSRHVDADGTSALGPG